jgi:hypothetical protein
MDLREKKNWSSKSPDRARTSSKVAAIHTTQGSRRELCSFRVVCSTRAQAPQQGLSSTGICKILFFPIPCLRGSFAVVVLGRSIGDVSIQCTGAPEKGSRGHGADPGKTELLGLFRLLKNRCRLRDLEEIGSALTDTDTNSLAPDLYAAKALIC